MGCRGGFGVVLWGRVHREEAAIKLIRGRSREKEMLQEIAILERAKTNYVTRFLGYSVCPDGIMLCMEYMAGGTLYQALHINEEFQWRNRQVDFSTDSARFASSEVWLSSLTFQGLHSNHVQYAIRSSIYSQNGNDILIYSQWTTQLMWPRCALQNKTARSGATK